MESVPAGAPDVLRLGDSLRNRREHPGIGAVAVSVGAHAAFLSLFFVAGIGFKHKTSEYPPIAIHLVSPPPTVKGPPLPIETTSAVTAAPKVETKVAPPKPAPKAQTQSATDSKVVSKPKDAKPAQGARPKPGPVGGEDLNIIQEGIAFSYPDYSNNVIKKLLQYFRWDKEANRTAQVEFYIRRDGSVGGVEIVRSSGSMEFDVAATDAVGNAGKQKAFGPLPKGWQGDRLKIAFTFAPNN